VRDAGARGNDRQTVIDRVFATKDRNSVIGNYSIDADGETTLSSYGVDRIVNGRPAYYRAIKIGPPSP
jgi:branched-chain amino acid transport system substrate-binding protein